MGLGTSNPWSLLHRCCHLTNYPFSIELAGEYRHDMLELSKALMDKGTNHLLIDPYTETKKKTATLLCFARKNGQNCEKSF